jgi:methylglutaconyl-CoA hydratase
MSELVTVQTLNHSAVCTLNVPHKRNPISPELRASLIAALDSLIHNDQVRSVIITGAGSAFCSGLDLEALSEQLQKTPEEHRADSQSIAEFFSYIVHYPKPTIAAVNGPAVAGGCGLALLCDFTLMSSAAFLSFSEVKIGFVPALVGIYLERMVGPKVSRDLLLTGRKVAAEEALALRLVTAVVEGVHLHEKATELALHLAKNSPVALRRTKALLTRAQALPLAESIALAVEINASARRTSECAEGVHAFLEKRVPKWSQGV